ncbi:MAG TPA: hypothetical protein VGC55_03110 [Dokdonella sp.]
MVGRWAALIGFLAALAARFALPCGVAQAAASADYSVDIAG